MFLTGMTVRRKKRFTMMTVLDVHDEKVICGWSQNGKFYKRAFNASELIVITLSINVIM
ncbi:TPA: hypothetical protein M5853_004980 [Klebsiella aerogenes]|nr:hypothetical protein [Klebsiella aerogenes]